MIEKYAVKIGRLWGAVRCKNGVDVAVEIHNDYILVRKPRYYPKDQALIISLMTGGEVIKYDD
jgi:hypothetical protein